MRFSGGAVFLCLFFLLLGVGVWYMSFSRPAIVSDSPVITSSENVCIEDRDCETPMEYLTQSICPFGSACVRGNCEVVCPLSYHDPDMSVSASYPVTCTKDADCDCSEYTRSDKKACVCVNNRCLVLVSTP